ncbi:MAG: polyphosphate kinase 2 [Gemmatimonadetes bacterium]|nr:polyphosphate kinase 2 [Gemmatimonadota bacterium]
MSEKYRPDGRITNAYYEKELARLQEELVALQDWIRHKGLRVAVIFEGRDTAGKGGSIKRITQTLNPRFARIVALGVPTEREKSQWYFQRYVPHLPAAGEMVFFDRSWYNRAVVERVMDFCTDDEYREFLRSCPQFERMLVNSGMILLKYWFSISAEEQERRFLKRIHDPKKRWKISPMDVASRAKWTEYSRAKDAMFMYTDIEECPWHVVKANVKRHARLNCIHHLLQSVEYTDLPDPPIELPPLQKDPNYRRPDIDSMTWIPEVYGGNAPGEGEAGE